VGTVTILGWVAAVVGVSIGLPQTVRLLRTRDVSGLSVPGLQAVLVINLAWAIHGFRVAQVNMVTVNIICLGTTLLILGLVARELGLSLARLSVPSVAGAAVMVAVDVAFGAAAFGTVAIIPAAIATAAQSLELVRAPRVDGVSPASLVLNALNQLLWATWGFLVPEPGTIVSSSVTLAIATFNLAWWCARRLGLRSFWTPTQTELVAAAVPVAPVE